MGAPVRRRDSAFAVIVREASVLLVRDRNDRWQLPGGALKTYESPHEGLRREVEEETGLSALRVRIQTGTYPRPDGSVVLVYLAAVPAGAEPAGPRNEIQTQRWVPRRKALRLLRPRARRRLADALGLRA
jgi:ADP-ribose pyrophosphatase YjhB (NUDIX family)